MYIKQDASLHSLFYLETAVHVSGGIITHHQERKPFPFQFFCQPHTPHFLFVLGGKEVGGLLVIFLQF
jgi:hypothetical protein